MRYHELLGLLDDVFAKYRKEENSPDSKWTPYCYYKNLSDTKNDYSVYVGSKGLREELIAILERCENEENFKFTDKQWQALALTLETANTQNNDDGAWTDIMFRAKYNFIESVFAFLNTQHVTLH
ncbi:MAG: hypothetical protein J6V44_00665 [Methanobrevibacter sp.]|nr:hypothetical protein [Methanobrevibacter sp.]